MMRKCKPLWLIRLLHYEYWHWRVFYFPLLPVYLWYALRARSFTFFRWANPSMHLGGLSGYSKYKASAAIAPCWVPPTALINKGTSVVDALMIARSAGIRFPLVAKPDKGERGKDVAILNSPDALAQYLKQLRADCLLQTYVEAPLEVGVLYARKPGEQKGRVTSVMLRQLMTVVGDGHSTVGQLLAQTDRFALQVVRLSQQNSAVLSTIPNRGDLVLVEPIGNHNRGTAFYNANHWITPQIHTLFDQIALLMPGFYYGRFDIKIQSRESLYTGEGLQIIEVNGVASEPAHIYDPGYSLFKAYRDILAHWELIWEISLQAKKQHHDHETKECADAAAFRTE
jgi:hypothetical protein